MVENDIGLELGNLYDAKETAFHIWTSVNIPIDTSHFIQMSAKAIADRVDQYWKTIEGLDKKVGKLHVIDNKSDFVTISFGMFS